MFYLFNNIKRRDIFDAMLKAFKTNDNNDIKHAKALLYDFSIENGITGNLWKSYIIYTFIFNENSYTRSIEKTKKIEIFAAVENDFKELYSIYSIKQDWMNDISNFKYIAKKTYLSNMINQLQYSISSYETFKENILSFYKTQGLGNMSAYKAFRVEDGKLFPIYNVLNVSFNDLIGYDNQKKLLIENTIDFINGRPFNNVLLYGDSGTGKSTSIKALLNTYFDLGLRIIEVYKHQMEEISKIIHTLKNRPYFYIIYMDDLSFDEDEKEYKYLKSIIEGGIEPKPNNVAIYATSNRRHLIKETVSDNYSIDDDLHRNETQAEKLSLAYRFGLQIYYGSLSPKEFRKMVLELALKNDIKIEEELLIKEASKWELTYGSLSGRCATQFINYLINKVNK